jgi:hypothetical protein
MTRLPANDKGGGGTPFQSFLKGGQFFFHSRSISGPDAMAVKTMYGAVPLRNALNWPAVLTYHQAEAYLEHLRTESSHGRP